MNLRPGPAKKAILIGTDGASMELWRRMAAWGRAPNMAKLLANGVSRPMLGTHPTLTPCGWTSLFSGSWQGTHGIMWWGSHRDGESMKTAQWTMAAHTSESEQIWTTAERAGKTPIMIKQEITWPATLERGMQIEGSGPGCIQLSPDRWLPPLRIRQLATPPRWRHHRPRSNRSQPRRHRRTIRLR